MNKNEGNGERKKFMKNFKKIMALIIAAVMIVSTMSVTALADPVDRTISVGNLEKGDKVTFYKVLGWAEDSDTAEEKGAVSGWYFEEPFATAFAESGDHGKAKLAAAINEDNVFMLTDALAGDIARVINSSTEAQLHDVTFGPDNAVDGVATHTFEDEDDDSTAKDGLYMAIVTPADHEYVYNPIFVHLDSSKDDDSFNAVETQSYYENQGAAKKSDVPLEKTATSNNDYTTPSDNGDTAKPGDILNFTVTTAIPGYGNEFLKPVYNVSDTMNGLELQYDPAEIKVKVGGTDITGTDKYTITGDTTGYQIKFDPTYLKTLKIATDLVIEYKAKVLDGENVNVIKEKNTVELEFSHDPSTENKDEPDGGEKKYKKDITNHYTFTIDANNLVQPDNSLIGESGSEIIKVGVDANGKPITSESTWSNITEEAGQAGPLAGAEFELLDKNGDSFNPQKLATSDAAGRLNFSGLDAGEYWLKETKAPAGFVKQSDPVKVTISATFDTKNVTEYYDQEGNWWDVDGEGRTAYTYEVKELKSYKVTYGEDASEYTFGHAHESKDSDIKWSVDSSKEAPQSIVNTKGVELPSTGGMGTTLFYIIGAILVVGAGIVLVTRRRMSAN